MFMFFYTSTYLNAKLCGDGTENKILVHGTGGIDKYSLPIIWRCKREMT